MIFKLEILIRSDETRKDIQRALKEVGVGVVDPDGALEGGVQINGKPCGEWAIVKSPSEHPFSVQPDWAARLPLQMQSVLFLAARGPDGVGKFHPCKDVIRAFRGCVLLAAKYGRPLEWGEEADDFMSLKKFGDERQWELITGDFKHAIDSLAYHYVMHFLHGAEILAYKHPDKRYRERWMYFYKAVVESMHLGIESEATLNIRLGDWGRKNWDARK